MLRVQSFSPEIEMETCLLSDTGLPSAPVALPGPAVMRPFLFPPLRTLVHMARGVCSHAEPYLGGKWLVHSSTRVSTWQGLSASLCLWSTARAGEGRGRLQPPGPPPHVGQAVLPAWDGGEKLPPSEMWAQLVCRFLLSVLYLPGKQELEALYCSKARNEYNKVSSSPETHLGRNFIPCSYLRINFHCLLGVVEQKLLARRGEINVHLKAGVLRDFPAVWTAAKWAVEGFCDGCVEKRALSLFCPDTKQEKKRR